MACSVDLDAKIERVFAFDPPSPPQHTYGDRDGDGDGEGGSRSRTTESLETSITILHQQPPSLSAQPTAQLLHQPRQPPSPPGRLRIRWTGRIVVPTLTEERNCERAALSAAMDHQDEYDYVECLIRGGIHCFTRDYRSRKTMCPPHLTVNYKTREQVRRGTHHPAHVFLRVRVRDVGEGEREEGGEEEGEGDVYEVDWVHWFAEKWDRGYYGNYGVVRR